MSLSVQFSSSAGLSLPARYTQPRPGQPASPALRFGTEFPPRLKRNSDCVPTPPGVAARMIDLLGVEPGMRVLEPSAGTGNIADEIRKHEGVCLDVVELDHELRGFLRNKGYNVVGDDFMAYGGRQYDRIIMNPPFSNKGHDEAQSVLHVKHAYSLLAPGGKLAAIVPEWMFRTRGKGRKPKEFISWLQSNTGGYSTHPLEAGTFDNDESSTPVLTRILVIQKPDMARQALSRQLDLIA